LTPNDFLIPNPLPDTPSPFDFLQYLDKELSNGSNSWQRLMPTNDRLWHYYQFKMQYVTGVPVGWTSDLAQYSYYVKKGLHIDSEETYDYFGVLRRQIYSITNKKGEKEKNEVPMLPFEYSYQIIANCHVEINPQGEYIHLSRDKTYDKVSKITSTITKAVINSFIQYCPHTACAGRRVRGTQHSADCAAAKKRKAEAGPNTNGPPKRKRTRQQSQEQEQQPPFPIVQMGQFNNEGYQPPQLQQPPFPIGQMRQFNNGHLFGPPDIRGIFGQIFDVQQDNEGYQPQQHQQPDPPKVPEVQNDINDYDFTVPQQPATVQMEQVNNGYPFQPTLIGQWGYEEYTRQQQLANAQTGQNDTIDPALLEYSSPYYQEQPQEAAATGNAPVDQNDNGEEWFGGLFNFEAGAEANPMPEFPYIDPSNWQFN
jgi:hypothetical protein